jgi:hypothetical protein
MAGGGESTVSIFQRFPVASAWQDGLADGANHSLDPWSSRHRRISLYTHPPGCLQPPDNRKAPPPGDGELFSKAIRAHPSSHRSCLLYAQLLAPARLQGIGVVRERFEGTREFRVLPGVLDRIAAGLPALVGLTQGDRIGRRAVDMPVGAATSRVDHVAVAHGSRRNRAGATRSCRRR